jgi:hypothetical protein
MFLPLCALGAILGVAGCVSPIVPPPPAAAAVAAPPAQMTVATPLPANVGEWRDWPLTPGDWVYRQDSRGSLALFGPKGQDALFLIRCDTGAHRVFLSRSGALADGETSRMTIRATTGTQSYKASGTGGKPAYVASEVTARDPQLDAMSFSRGRFIVSVQGVRDLVVPAWPEFARVVEDCRG